MPTIEATKQTPTIFTRWGITPDSAAYKLYAQPPAQLQAPAPVQLQAPTPAPVVEDSTSVKGAVLHAATANTADDMLSSAKDIVGNLAAYEAKKKAAALSDASLQAGVPQLEQRLQAEIAADKAHRYYNGADSQATTDVRQQLERARANSQTIANNLLSSDPELARTKVEAEFTANKMASNALKMQSRDELANQHDYEKGLLLSNKTRETLKYFYPAETLGMSAGTMYDFNKNNKNKEIQAVTNNADNPDLLLELATTGGSVRAKDFLAHQSAVETSGTDNTTSMDYLAAKDKANLMIDKISVLASTPEEAIKQSYGAANSDKAKEKIQEFTTKLINLSPKEQESYSKSIGLYYAKQVVEGQQVADFKLISNWSKAEKAALTTSPLTSDLINRAAEKKGGQQGLVTIQDLIHEVNLLEPSKQSAAFKFLADHAGAEADARSKGLFGLNTNRFELEKQLQKELVLNKMGIDTSGNTLGGDSLLTLLGKGASAVGDSFANAANRAIFAAELPRQAVVAAVTTPFSQYGNVLKNTLQQSQDAANRIIGKRSK